MSASRKRHCRWAASDPMVRCHDREWDVPAHDDRRLFEFLILEGAQGGLSWETVLKKRSSSRKAFDNFDAGKITRCAAGKTQAVGTVNDHVTTCFRYPSRATRGSTVSPPRAESRGHSSRSL